MEVDPTVALVVPLVVTLIRNFIPAVADSPTWSLVLAVALGALTSLASSLGIPLPGPDVGVLGGMASALLGVGGVEVAKLAPKVRALNKSGTQPRAPKS